MPSDSSHRVAVYGGASWDLRCRALLGSQHRMSQTHMLFSSASWLDIVAGNGAENVLRPDTKPVLPALPPEILEAVENAELGGGALNSLSVLHTLLPGYQWVYLDACHSEPALDARLETIGARGVFLDARAIPQNALVPLPGAEKVILKTAIQPLDALSFYQANQIAASMSAASAVLINSPKDQPVSLRIIELAREIHIPVTTVGTLSLPPAFTLDVLIPASAAFIVHSLDLDAMMNETRGSSSAGVLMQALELRAGAAGTTDLYVTRGGDGVLVVPAHGCEAYEVRLRGTEADHVRALLRRNPLASVGAGDAFAAGIFAFREQGRSSVPWCRTVSSPAVLAAIAGCCAAVRWMGYMRPLTPEAFAVRAIVSRRHRTQRSAVVPVATCCAAEIPTGG